MSAKWMGYFFDDTDLADSELLLALAIADHADTEGICFPGLPKLATKIRKTERQTKRLLKQLEEKGHVDITRQYGRGKLSIYQLLKKVSSASPLISDKGDIDTTQKGDTEDQEKVTSHARVLDQPLLEPNREPTIHDQAREVFVYWQEKLNYPKRSFEPREKFILARLKEKLTVDDLKKAVDGVLNSPFHLGDNDQHTKYDDIENIFRNQIRVEKFIELADQQPFSANGVEPRRDSLRDKRETKAQI